MKLLSKLFLILLFAGSAMMQAMEHNMEHNVETIFEELPSWSLEEKNSYLRLYARQGKLVRVRRLLDNGASFELKESELGITPLMFASSCGQLAIVREFLARGSEIEAKNKFGRTALMVAVHGNHLSVVRELLARGANIKARDDLDRTVLDYAQLDYAHMRRCNNDKMNKLLYLKYFSQGQSVVYRLCNRELGIK